MKVSTTMKEVKDNHKDLLTRFWDTVEDTDQWTRARSRNRTSLRLILLFELSSLIPSDPPESSREERRAEFMEDEGFKVLLKCPCWVCRKPATQRHHLIQLQNGGRNVKENVIPICTECHSEVHPWMKPEEKKEAAPKKQRRVRRARSKRIKKKKPRRAGVPNGKQLVMKGGVILVGCHKGKHINDLSCPQIRSLITHYAERASSRVAKEMLRTLRQKEFGSWRGSLTDLS